MTVLYKALMVLAVELKEHLVLINRLVINLMMKMTTK